MQPFRTARSHAGRVIRSVFRGAAACPTLRIVQADAVAMRASTPIGSGSAHGAAARTPWPQALLSVLFAAFFALKLAEGVLGLEAWPLTDVSMFHARQPFDVVPIRARLFGVRNGTTFELEPLDLRLSEDEFLTRLRDEDDLGRACSDFARDYNRRLVRRGRSAERITAAWATREEIVRPGFERRPWRIRVECAVDEPPAPGADP